MNLPEDLFLFLSTCPSYNLTSEEQSHSGNFAQQVNDARDRQDETNNDKGPQRVGNKLVGDIGQVAVSRYCGGSPNHEVYGDKCFHSIPPDLFDNDTEVKTCSIQEAIDNSMSWLIWLHSDIVQFPANQLITLVVANPETHQAWLVGTVYASELVGRFVKPRDPNKIGRKLAICWDGPKGIKDIVKRFSHQ